jgi:calcineurin-like phosphoesterase family protein/purple acid phosphatase-like protein/K319-like protein
MKSVLRSINITLVLVLCATAAFAGIRKGPYLLFEGSNTAMSVLWQTDMTESNTLRWGTDTSYTMGQTTVGTYGADFQHKYTITGLQPGTKYYYEVPGYGSGSFVTAPDAAATAVKLIAYGDSRSDPASHESVAARMRTRIAADPALQSIVLHDGDFIASDTEADWTSQYFVSGATYPNMRAFQTEVPMIGARGNHEGTGAVYQKYFPYPYAAGYYWSFDYGPVHVTVVDNYTSFTSGSAQYNWLVNDLASTTKPWKVILTHEPGWGAGTHANNTTIQSVIHPLVKQYGVDLFINGHNHNYARALVEGKNYVTTGGGGASLYVPNASATNIVKVDQSYHYTEIDINGSTLTMTARRADGTVIETVAVNHGNQSPVANAGVDQSVTDSDGNGSQAVTLNGSASSDPDGTIASYVWKEGATQIATGATPAVTLAVGSHTITLTVTDNLGATATDTMVATVNAAGNLPPVANAGVDQTVTDSDGNGSQAVTLNGAASSDPDGTIASYVWKEGATQIATGATPAVTLAVGVHTITLTVTDNLGATATDTMVATVNAAGGTPVTVTSQVNTGNDDVEQRQTGGTMYNNSSDLELVYDTATTGNQYVGLRFTGVNVPKGKTITNAYIQFTVDETGSTATSLTVKGQAADNPGTFTTAANNVSSRATTAASVAWAPAAWTTIDAAGTAQQTPDLKNIVQEITNRAGWVQNNAMVFVITGTGKRTARAYEAAAAKAAKLVVTYQ